MPLNEHRYSNRFILNLSNIFKDHRKKGFILINTSWKSIKCVKDHISKVYGIKEKFYLLNEEGIFYPENELIDVIQSKDVLCVNLLHEEIPKSVVNTTSSGLSKELGSATSSSYSSEDNAIVHQVFNDLSIRSDNTKTTSEKDDQLPEIVLKQKRKRIRKRRKKSEETVKEVQPKVKCYGKDLVTPRNIDINLKGKHVKFDESGECLETEKDHPKVDQDKPQINLNTDTKARIIRAIEIQEIDLELDHKNEKIEEEEKTTLKVPNLKRFDEAFLEEIRPSLHIFPEIESLPSEGDIVAFKYPKSHNEGPTITDQVGYVMEVNSMEQEIKFQVLAGKCFLREFLDFNDIVVLPREKVLELRLLSR